MLILFIFFAFLNDIDFKSSFSFKLVLRKLFGVEHVKQTVEQLSGDKRRAYARDVHMYRYI